MWIILPVKKFENAKQRLSGLLDAREREALAHAMFADLLDILRNVRRASGVVVVTCEERAKSCARTVGATVLSMPVENGQSAAVAHGADYLAAMGEKNFVTMPADLPLATAMDVDAVIAAHPRGPGITIVPARDHFGTNAIAVSPPNGIEFRFGPDSYARHLNEARTACLPVCVVERPNLGLDIDTPEDLALLQRRGACNRVARVLAASGLPERLPSPVDRPMVEAVAV